MMMKSIKKSAHRLIPLLLVANILVLVFGAGIYSFSCPCSLIVDEPYRTILGLQVSPLFFSIFVSNIASLLLLTFCFNSERWFNE